VTGSAPISAAILAGGFGTRLRAAVPGIPKVLAEVRGRRFIDYLLMQLARANVRSVVLCTGYLGDQVEEVLGGSYEGMHLSYSRELEPLGTGGALRFALPKIKSEHVLVLNGDSYCDVGIDEFMRWHIDRASDATILLSEVEDTRRFGSVEIDEGGRVRQFREKIEAGGRGWVNGGLYLIRRNRIKEIPSRRPVSLEREIFPQWVGRGLHGFRAPGRLWDIGVPESYALANAEFAVGRL